MPTYFPLTRAQRACRSRTSTCRKFSSSTPMPPSANCGTSRASSYILCSDRPGKLTSAANPSRCSLCGTPPTARLWRGQRYPACTRTGAPASERRVSSPSSRRESICKRPQQRRLNSLREKFALKSPLRHLSPRAKSCFDRLACREGRAKASCHHSLCRGSQAADPFFVADSTVTFFLLRHQMGEFLWMG